MNQPLDITSSLRQFFDYAGLFPPAGLDMSSAVENYKRYASSQHAGVLSAFVVPASRLEEFARCVDGIEGAAHWRLSVLCADWASEAGILKDFASNPTNAHIASIETRQVESAAAIREAFSDVFVELPLNNHLSETIPRLRKLGAYAKVRTGGLSPEAFPDCAALAEFIFRCVSAGVSFKATAGLHHPVRSTRPASDSKDACTVHMHGFLNVVVATACAIAGRSQSDIAAVLASESYESLIQDVTGEEFQVARKSFKSVGSCSFEEPIIDLQLLGCIDGSPNTRASLIHDGTP